MEVFEKLNQPLDESAIKHREQGGRTFSYIEGWYARDQANRIFGYDGWSSETLSLEQVAQYTQQDRYGKEQFVVTYVAKVRVHALGVYRDGTGAATSHSSSLGEAIENAAKSAETDAIKRALASFGPQFGLHLYKGEEENVEREAEPGMGAATPQKQKPASSSDKPTVKNHNAKASERQVGYIYTLMKGVKIPEQHRKPFLEYLTAGEPLTKGEASKIIDLFKNGEYKDLWQAYAQDNVDEVDEVF